MNPTHPEALPAASSVTIEAVLRAVTAFGLPGSLIEFPPEPITGESGRMFADMVRHHRITGLAVQAFTYGDLLVDDPTREAILNAHESALVGCLELERIMLHVVAECERIGIDYRITKGPAVAHLDYPQPALRSFIDLDVMVQGSDIDRMGQLLRETGFDRIDAEPRNGFDSKYGKSVTYRSAGGYEVDVHRTFAMGAAGLTVNLDDVWCDPEYFTVAGERIKAFPAELRLMHACYHSTLGDAPPRLVPLRDVTELALFGRVDPEAIRVYAQRWQGTAVVTTAIRRAWELFEVADVTALDAWARGYRPSPSELRQLQSYGSGSSYSGKVVAAAHVLPLDKRFEFVSGWLWPSREFLAHHRKTRSQWLLRGLSRVGKRQHRR